MIKAPRVAVVACFMLSIYLAWDMLTFKHYPQVMIVNGPWFSLRNMGACDWIEFGILVIVYFVLLQAPQIIYLVRNRLAPQPIRHVENPNGEGDDHG